MFLKISLNSLHNTQGSKKRKKRVGRGIGSGSGKTCGRGEKGQKSRSGVSIKTEGGQMPLIKRLPKRGFNSLNPVKYSTVTLRAIGEAVALGRIDISEEVTPNLLVKLGIIKNLNLPVKVIGAVEGVQHKLLMRLDAYSKSVVAAVETVGGKIF